MAEWQDMSRCHADLDTGTGEGINRFPVVPQLTARDDLEKISSGILYFIIISKWPCLAEVMSYNGRLYDTGECHG